MKVYIENKFLSLRGSSGVYDENKEDVFFVKGKLFSIRHKKRVCDLNGKVLFTVKNKLMDFFAHSAYILDQNNQKIALVKKPFLSFKKYIVEGYKDEILIDGDFFSLESTIVKNGKEMGKIRRQITFFVDAFSLEAEEKDIPFLIALVIAIDNILDNKYKSNR